MFGYQTLACVIVEQTILYAQEQCEHGQARDLPDRALGECSEVYNPYSAWRVQHLS
jgi:hypothetical protein